MTSDGTSSSNSSATTLDTALDDIDAFSWRCSAFPDPKNYVHFAILIALNVAIMLPVKFTLITVFTRAGKTLLEPHWKHALAVAGLAYLEVWVAYAEFAFQMLMDPAEGVRRAHDLSTPPPTTLT